MKIIYENTYLLYYLAMKNSARYGSVTGSLTSFRKPLGWVRVFPSVFSSKNTVLQMYGTVRLNGTNNSAVVKFYCRMFLINKQIILIKNYITSKPLISLWEFRTGLSNSKIMILTPYH